MNGGGVVVPDDLAEHMGRFTGRRWVLERLDAWLAGGERRFLLTGPPGTGKSLVAARVVQISNGQASSDGLANLGRETVALALFCQARNPWTQNPLSFVEAVSGRLAGLHEGFRAALLRTGHREISISGEARTGTVAAGATVAGVNVAVHIHNLSPVLAFDEAVRKPLAALGDQGIGRPVTILVDALDEALRIGRGSLVELLAQVLEGGSELPPSLRFVLTARSNEARVLDELGLADLDLLADAPSEADDVGRYARASLDWLTEPARSTLAARVAAQSGGNFLYAYHVLDDLGRHPERLGDPATFRLPADLQEVYRDFLSRELAPNRQDPDWRSRYRPLLGLLAAARGDGLGPAAIAGPAGRLAGRRVGASEAADSLLACAQFLNGPLPDGPVRIYHQSFREFLLADPDLRGAHAEANLALAEHFLDEWGSDWERCEDDYALLHTGAHLAEAARDAGTRAERAALRGRLTGLLTDFGLLRAKLGRHGARALAEDHRLAAGVLGDGGDDAPALQALREAVQLSAGALDRDPDQLPAQLLGRLAGYRSLAPIAGLLEQADRWRGRPWLCPMTPGLTAPGPVRHILRHGRVQLAVTPDGRRALSGAEDGTVIVWDLEQGLPLRGLPHFEPAAWPQDVRTAAITAVAFTPDGRRAVVASGGGVIKVWDLEDVERPPLTVDHGSTLRAVAVAADGRTALSVADGRGMFPYWFVAARLWDLDTGAELRLVRFVDQVFECVALAPDARRIVVRSLTRSGVDRLQAADLDEGEAEVWEGPDGVRRYLVDGHARTLQDPSFVKALAVTPAGGLAISSQDAPAGDQAGLSLFEVDGGGAPRFVAAGEQDRRVPGAFALAVTPDGRRALSGHMDGTLRVWDLDGVGLRRTLPHSPGVVAVALTPDGRSAVSAGLDGTLKVWDLAMAVERGGEAPPHANMVMAVAITPDGRRALTGSLDGSLVVWDRSEAWRARALGSAPAAVVALAVTPDGRRAVCSCMDGSLTGWDLAGGPEPERLDDWGDGNMNVALAPDARRAIFSPPLMRLAAMLGDADPQPEVRFEVWDLDRDPPRRAVVGEGREHVVDLTPDGRLAVTLPTASYDGRVNLWDLEQGGEPRTLRLDGDVTAAVLTPDGRRLLASSHRVDPTSGLDGRLVVCDLDGDDPPRLLAQDDPMTRLAVSRDGRWLVSCSAGGTVEVWDLVALEPVASFMADNAVTACAVALLADGVLVVAGGAGGEVHVLHLRG